MGDANRYSIVEFLYTGPWWRARYLILLNLCLVLPLVTSFVSGLDTSLLNGLQILPAWQDFYGHPAGKRLGLINSAQDIGALACLPFAPYVSDSFGRRGAIFLGALCMLSGVALQGIAPNVNTLIGARILIGTGLTFSANASPLLIAELSYPTQRAKFTSLYNTFWYAGSVVSAWICFGAYARAGNTIWSWRVPALAQAVAPLLQIVIIWFLPESPRFLVSQGLESTAAKTLARFHTPNNDERDPLVRYEMAQIRHALKLEKETNRLSYLALFNTPGNRKRMRIIIGLAVFSQWSGNGLVSYYINLVLEGVGITNPVTKAGINGGLQLFNLIVAVSGAMLVDKVGRRTLFIFSNVGMLIMFTGWTATTAVFQTTSNSSASTATAKATVPLIFLFFFFYDLAYTPVLVSYTVEILPYQIRAKGFSFMNLIVCLTQAFNQFINPWALDAIRWKYYLVYCVWLVCELVFVCLFLVETKGRTLEETAALFDGEQKPDSIKQVASEAVATGIDSQKMRIHISKTVDSELYIRGLAKIPNAGSYHDLVELMPSRKPSRSTLKSTMRTAFDGNTAPAGEDRDDGESQSDRRSTLSGTTC